MIAKASRSMLEYLSSVDDNFLETLITGCPFSEITQLSACSVIAVITVFSLSGEHGWTTGFQQSCCLILNSVSH